MQDLPTRPVRAQRPRRRGLRPARVLAAVAACLLALIVVAVVFSPERSERAGVSASATDDGSEADPTTTEEGAGPVTEALAALPVKGRAPLTGYDRDEFNHWITRDGCDTRARILDRDASAGTARRDEDGCVDGATIDGPYSGSPISEDPGPASDVDVDHVVALADAWRSGAQQLAEDEREQLANDPLNLLAVEDGLNQQKGDSNAASWLPPNKAFRCDYVARQVAVKAEYELWVTGAERDAIARVLGGCPGHPLPAA